MFLFAVSPTYWLVMTRGAVSFLLLHHHMVLNIGPALVTFELKECSVYLQKSEWQSVGWTPGPVLYTGGITFFFKFAFFSLKISFDVPRYLQGPTGGIAFLSN